MNHDCQATLWGVFLSKLQLFFTVRMLRVPCQDYNKRNIKEYQFFYETKVHIFYKPIWST